MKYGWNETGVNGVMGADTVAAIMKFQLIYRLPPTGQLDNVTLDLINSEYKKGAVIKAGILGTKIPLYASVASGISWYQKNGNYQSRETGYIPKAGDVIFFNKNGQNHTGIVIAYDPRTNTVYTIEGNSSDSVAARSYNLNNTYIKGYGVNGGTGNGEIPKNATGGAGLKTR